MHWQTMDGTNRARDLISVGNMLRGYNGGTLGPHGMEAKKREDRTVEQGMNKKGDGDGQIRQSNSAHSMDLAPDNSKWGKCKLV